MDLQKIFRIPEPKAKKLVKIIEKIGEDEAYLKAYLRNNPKPKQLGSKRRSLSIMEQQSVIAILMLQNIEERKTMARIAIEIAVRKL